jgi:hypothetical protein
MRAVGAVVAGLVDDPFLAEGFHRGRCHRLRVGPVPGLCVVDGDMITVERVDRMELTPQRGIGAVVADEEGADHVAEFLDGLVGGVLGAA